jgi:lysyl endopeptidase
MRVLTWIMAGWLLAGLAFGEDVRLNSLHTAEPVEKSSILASTVFRLSGDQAVVVRLPAVSDAEPESLNQINQSPGGRVRPLAVGFPRALPSPVRLAPGQDENRWQAAAGGGLVTQIRLVSPGAAALRAEFSFGELPDGTELKFQGSNSTATLVGPVTADNIRRQGNIYWSPIVEGEAMTIEIFWPGQEALPLDGRILRVSHLVVKPSEAALKAYSSSYCEVNLACLSDSAAISKGKAVARMYFVKSGVAYVCTGTLLNNSRVDQTPYFLTAAHCISDQAVASTLNTYWFYDSSSCSTNSVSTSAVQRVNGAQLLYTNPNTYEVSLLRLNDTPPSGVVFSGWDSSALTVGAMALGIHHPGGDLKKYASGNVVDTALSILLTNNNITYRNFTQAVWTTGLVEGGSSGSGLFSNAGSGEYRLRGTLTSGSGSCDDGGQKTGIYSPFSSYYSAIQSYLNPTVTSPVVTPQSGWWWNPSESGRGFSVEIRNGKLFMAGYLYDSVGRATWFASSGAMYSSSSYTGTMTTYAAGQTLTGSYMTPVTTGSSGTISLTFADATHGSLTWPGGTIPIERFNIVSGGVSAPAASFQPETGWWWNPAESGRGFSLEIQKGTLFMAGYMYDAQGNPTWYASSNTLSTQSSYSGTWIQYGYGQTLTGAYQAPVVLNSNVGAAQITFTDTTHGIMILPGGRSIQLERFRF